VRVQVRIYDNTGRRIAHEEETVALDISPEAARHHARMAARMAASVTAATIAAGEPESEERSAP